MSRIGKRVFWGTVLLSVAGLLILPSDLVAQGRLRPRATPSRPPTLSAGSGQSNPNGSGDLASHLPPAGIQHYHQNPADLLALLEKSVEFQRQFPDTAQNRSPWGVMHTTLAWGSAGEVWIDDQPYNAIDALCHNQRLKGVQLLSVRGGLPHPLEGPGLQGHPGQLLAILAQNQVPLDYPIRIGDQSFTVADLVKYEQQTCRSNLELTFKLLGLSHYLPVDATWTAEDGGAWSVERLLRLELRQPINGRQTCGGTHRLMAIHLAVAKRRADVGELDQTWSVAATYIDDYHAYAMSLFNPDGSFSTEWLERRAALVNPQRRVQTTGHVLEWLAVSLPDDQLQDERLMGSFAYLSALLMVNIGESWAVGPRAHALRAMRIYRDRLAAQLPASADSPLHKLATDLPEEVLDPPGTSAETAGADPATTASISAARLTEEVPATATTGLATATEASAEIGPAVAVPAKAAASGGETESPTRPVDSRPQR
jgi:hypothetical protein